LAISEFSTPAADRYLEDYPIGAVYEYGPITVDEAEVLAFARRYDPQAMHVDPVAAAAGPFHGLIASGWHTASMMMRPFVDYYLSSVAGLASPGVDELRWNRPVRPGDRLMVRVTTTEARPSRSKPDRGIIFATIEGINQDGVVVCSMKAMTMMAKRNR
jgi:acyl dehydratase